MDTVTVALGDRSYTIHIAEHILAKAGELLSELRLNPKAAIITNSTIAPLYAEMLTGSMAKAGFKTSVIQLPDGEQYKNLEQIFFLYTKLLDFNLDRRSPVLALGGGVVGDMAGFAASTFLRGVPFIQIPTTLLAQVDSSVGGKTGVNLPQGKNLVGAFYQPRMVIIDPLVLRTLDARELRSGLAEVIKYALIHDHDFFLFLERNIEALMRLDTAALSFVIKKCCSIKAGITSQDETEQGIRAFLNFGHTIGHAVETLTDYKTYTHGEAVAIGMAAVARISSRLGYCTHHESDRTHELLQRAGLPTALPSFPVSAYRSIIQKDKKRSGDSVRMVLMKKIGDVFTAELAAQQVQDLLSGELNLIQG